MMQSELVTQDKNGKNPDALFTIAAVNAAHGQYVKAIKCLKELEEVDPDYPGLWRLKARIFELMGDHKMAARCWKRGSDGHK